MIDTPPPASGADSGAPAESPTCDTWDQRLAGAISFVRRRLAGEYQVDEFGYDHDFTEAVLAPSFRQLYQRWFRVSVTGIDHVPADGAALIVANHSGIIPLDGAMLSLALRDHHPAQRVLRLLAANLLFELPVVGSIARKGGATLAAPDDVHRLLERGELTGVFPEGFKGIGKPFSARYQLQRFGRGGFVAAALRSRAPIIPCAIIGAEETYPMIGNAKAVARLLKLPYFPITPTFPLLGPLGAIPLPAKWQIVFCPPIVTEGSEASPDDPLAVFNLADQVRETIQTTLNAALAQRRSVWG